MAGIDQKTLWAFANIVRGGKGVEPTKRVLATFLRTDRDGTGWVRLAGSSEETPVNGSSFASAKAGDTVELTIGDGVLSVSGNSSDPAVGQSKVTEIVRPMVSEVRTRLERSVSVAEAIADAAQKVADAVNQHFFSDTNGIHVTSTTQDEWDAQHTGPNVLINSLGQLFRDGLNNLLTLTTENGARALTIWDGLGNSAANVLATFSANGIRFADGTSFDIGDSSAYINFDGNGHISIGGNGLTIGGYATDSDVASAISSISVGGRNLLTGSGDWSNISTSSTNPGTVSGDTFTFSSHASLAWYGVHLSYPHMPFSDVDGKTLTLSFDYRSDNFSDTTGDHYIYINAAASATIDGGRSKYRQLSTDAFNGVYVPTTAWQRGTITFDLSESLLTSGSGACNYFYIQFYNHTLNSLQLRHVKLEVGNVATDWTPAPEDVQAAVSEAAKTATNYITADSTGIKIHMSDSPTTYQHQSSIATTYYVNGNKRAEVSADGLEVFDGTPGYEESVAAFGTVARLGKANGNKVIVDSTGVHIYNVISISDEQGPQVAQVAAFGQAPGELTTTILSDEPDIGTNYTIPVEAIDNISIILDNQTLDEDTDYTLSSGIVTLLESTTVTSILDDSGSSGEEGSEDVEAHSLTCEYSASAGVGLAIGASVTRPGLDVAERAIFRHPSFVEASHSTANADTGFRAVRNDTGIQVFCGIGIGGVNHGVYSQTLKRWLINADTNAVHVAPHTVTDGNINIKSKWVYATTPSASKGNGWGHGLQYLDTAGALVGVVKAYSLTTGEKGIQLQATRNVNSTTYNNGIRFGVDASGNLKLAFSGGGRLLWRQALGFDSGYVSASYGGSDNAPKNAYRDIPITFNFTHTYAPHVVVTFATGSTGVTMGGLSLSAFNVTYTGCTVRIYNNTSDARNPPLYWVAID